MLKINVQNPPTIRVLLRTLYLGITMKGIRFVEKWYTAEHIPSHLTKLYRLLLRLIWMKGTMTTNLARRLGYSNNVLKLASSGSYVEIHNRILRLSEAIQNKVVAMIGEAPRRIYA